MSDKVKLRVDLTSKEDVANKVTSISSSSTNTHYPTAKAVYDALSDVIASSGGNYIYDFYLDSSNDDIVLEYDSASGGGTSGGSSVDIVTSWEQTLSDEKVPSEKLVKNSLDLKSDSTHTHSQYLTEHQSLTNYVQKENGKGLFSGSYADLTNKPSYTATITSSTTGAYKIGSINISGTNVDIYGKDTDTHQSLTDYVQKSNTTGLLKNDGTVMTSGTASTNYSAGNHTHSGYVSATKVTSWSSTVSDSNVPSEKLVKDYIDEQIGTAIQYIQQ